MLELSYVGIVNDLPFVRFIQINVRRYVEIAERYGIMGMPLSCVSATVRSCIKPSAASDGRDWTAILPKCCINKGSVYLWEKLD